MQRTSNVNNSNSNASSNAQVTSATAAQYSNYYMLHSTCVAAPQQRNSNATVSATATQTKKAQVIAMLQSANGTTVLQIAAQLNISKVAARSLIGDVRAAKLRVTCVNNVYKLA